MTICQSVALLPQAPSTQVLSTTLALKTSPTAHTLRDGPSRTEPLVKILASAETKPRAAPHRGGRSIPLKSTMLRDQVKWRSKSSRLERSTAERSAERSARSAHRFTHRYIKQRSHHHSSGCGPSGSCCAAPGSRCAWASHAGAGLCLGSGATHQLNSSTKHALRTSSEAPP